MRIYKLSFLLIFFVLHSNFSHAQNKASVTKTISKYTPPKLTTLLGSYKDSSIVNAGEVENIIGMPFKVMDDKKNVYAISSYQFLYKKNVLTENEETGKATAATSIISERFKTTPLPELWIKNVREQLTKGELLYFFDIIVKDAQGRVMYAPDIKIVVQ